MYETSISPQRRLRIGRAQRFSASAYRLRNVIEWENYTWIYLFFSFLLNHILIFAELSKLPQSTFSSLINQATSTVFVIIYLSIAGRIIYNITVRALLKYGMNKDKHILNTVVSLINSTLALPFFIVFAYFSVISTGSIFAARSSLWNLLKSLISPAGDAQPFVLLSLANFAGMYIMSLALTVFLFFNSVRSITNLIHTFLLLPRQNTIKKTLTIKNFHHSDYDAVQKIYITTKNKENPAHVYTKKDFDTFLKDADIRYIRVLLEKGNPIGFYLTSHHRTVLETMMVDQENQGRSLHEEFLKDFEKTARGRFIKSIKAHFPSKDTKTADFLIKRGWKIEPTTKVGHIELTKQISRKAGISEV